MTSKSTSEKKISIDSPVQYVKGVGPKRAAVLNKSGIHTVEDLLYHFPRRYLDRSRVQRIGSLRTGQDVTVIAQIQSAQTLQGRRKRYSVLVGDGTGFMHCLWFQGISYISKVFKGGETVAFSGKVAFYKGPQLVHPEFDIISDPEDPDTIHTGGIIPMYPSTESLSRAGLDSRGFRRILHDLVTLSFPSIEETLSESILKRLSLPDLFQSLKNIHFPQSWPLFDKVQYRLKFEELFYIQLFLRLQRQKRKIEKKGIAFNHVGEQTRNLVDKLPFELTDAQKRVLREIHTDMKSNKPMNRLLQGDVGSGKTVIACILMMIAVENGYQTALMAPTEILAEQHYLTVHKWLESLGAKVGMLKGSQSAAEKKAVYEKLQTGEINIVVGTHALIQDKVEFDKLGFVVVDEQHRFGVLQRANLMRKGVSPDVLVMTATPIPRTLALTLYGDLDVSILNELPKGRQPIRTVWRAENKRDAVYEFIRDEIQKGRQVYIVYPLVEESEKMDLAAATEGHAHLLQNVFPELHVGLLHGRMKAEEKESVMQAFKSGEIHILVSTTVIEVGVDVPNASMMLIENAERFGLTQLHQLRGRIGRGTHKSTCVLLAQYPISDDGKKRLKTMTETQDGFKISEVDLEIRGPGELFGTRQSGLLNLKIANLATDFEILQKARDEADRIVEDDPVLSKSENESIGRVYQEKYRHQFGLIEVG